MTAQNGAACIVVNGPSAVGKSTLITGIQHRSSVPILRFGVDELYRMVPAPWAGGNDDALHGDRGFRYRGHFTEDGSLGSREIVNGPDAIEMLKAMNAAIVGMLELGVCVIVDGQAFEPEVNRDLETRLRQLQRDRGVSVFIVELAAESRELQLRNSTHAHPTSLYLDHVNRQKQSAAPDLLVDTNGMSQGEVIESVWRWLNARFDFATRN